MSACQKKFFSPSKNKISLSVEDAFLCSCLPPPFDCPDISRRESFVSLSLSLPPPLLMKLLFSSAVSF